MDFPAMTTDWTASPERYSSMPYRRCGQSGIMLPAISLGLWHNFGGVDDLAHSRAMHLHAFDMGINHFDLANNYGPPPGSAEQTLGKILKSDLAAHRDELMITTKAGHIMWPGPYGVWTSRKSMLASLDQSLGRMGLDYVDIYYIHRPDANTPVEETVGAMVQAVRSGKALYVGVSSFSAAQAREVARLLREEKIPLFMEMMNYNIFSRNAEDDGLLPVLMELGTGFMPFCPLAQGVLTDRYLTEVPADSRAAKPHGFLKKETLTPERISQLKQLNEIAKARGQSLAQMSLAWLLAKPGVTSVLIGASKISQIDDNRKCLDNLEFSEEELQAIEKISRPA